MVYGNVLSRGERRNVNNSNDVRKFFKELTARNEAIRCGLVTGFYQLLVKSMHKKVLKGTVVDA